MARPYFLRSTRLAFGTWAPDDVPLAMALWGDPRVTSRIGGPFAPEQVLERLAAEIATQAAHGIQYWPLFRLADGEHVGCCGLRPRSADGNVLEIGYHLRFEHWGQGYASESARAVMYHAFSTLGVGGLFAGHHPDNERSREVLRRLGFRHTHEEFHAPTGLQHPSYLLTADEFARAPDRSHPTPSG